jgi:hypothetical protein
MAPSFLQSYVVPVVSFRDTESGAVIVQSFGTAFLIGNKGVFITASHVLQESFSAVTNTDQCVGLVGKGSGGTQIASVVAPVVLHDAAPRDVDIAVGLTAYRSETSLRLSRRTPVEWADVAALGYPAEGVSGPAEALMLNLRAHKGYVQRMLRRGDVFSKPNAEGFELNFVLARGMSGSPLFIHAGAHDDVVGVCTGSARSETIVERVKEVRENNKVYEEMSLEVNQFGIAESIAPLLDWQPEGFDGQTLAALGEVVY